MLSLELVDKRKKSITNTNSFSTTLVKKVYIRSTKHSEMLLILTKKYWFGIFSFVYCVDTFPLNPCPRWEAEGLHLFSFDQAAAECQISSWIKWEKKPEGFSMRSLLFCQINSTNLPPHKGGVVQ